MKKYLLLFLVGCWSAVAVAQGISFFEGTWEDAKEAAAKEEKLIFVDAFAKWCGPCKRMAKNVFTNPAVGEYYNENFISLKIDMEETMGIEFGKEYPVSAYPTLLYIDEHGEVVKKVVGGRDVAAFIELGKMIVSSFDRSGDYAALYEEGNRDYDLVLKYVKALNRANKSSLKVSNDYLRSEPDIDESQRVHFLFEAMTHADSRLFDLFVAERPLIEKIKGKEAVASKIEAACWNTINNAIEFQVRDLTEEAKKKMKTHCVDKANVFAREADYLYAKSVDDVPLMCEAALNMAEDLLSQNPEDLHLLAEDLFLYKAIDPMAVETAEKIVGMALKKIERPDFLLTHAKIMMAQNRSKKALKSLNKALDSGVASGALKREIEDLIKSIQEG